LVVAMLALGMRYGFAWVTAAADQDPESPTVVATRPDALQAAPLVSKLQQNGINAVATGTHTSGFQVEIASEVKIVVPKQEAAKAMEILGEETTG
jgi:UDP-N-acetylglucosamine 2-epimerase